MTSPTPLLVHLGDDEHGVDRYAREIARRLAAAHPGAALVLPGDVAPGAWVHLHFTDRLWGASPADAADVVERLAARARVSVTMHDVPQASDGSESMRRRAEAYGRVARVASVVVCNSDHERALLRACVAEGTDLRVVPLPCEPPAHAHDAPPTREEIGVLGFVYPGKGHLEAIGASASLVRPLPVVALGRAAPGHDGDLETLVREGARLGVPVASTGFLSDAALVERMRSTLVPVVAHRHVSASGSLNSWIGAGRRPIVVRNAYFDEMAALRPGTTWSVPLEGLTSAIAAAIADPSRTWLAADARTRPDLDDVVDAYLDVWRGW